MSIPDAALLRNLAEDVPDMAPAIRHQLRAIADRLDTEKLQGHLRCFRCGWKADITYTFGEQPPSAA